MGKSISQLQHEVHAAARDNGWWEARDGIVKAADYADPELAVPAQANIVIAALGLICAEAAEAMENVREGYKDDDKLPEYSGFQVELADIIIRTLDLAGRYNVPLEEIIEKKLKKNRERGYLHGGKKA